jgi:head-tail adaptor
MEQKHALAATSVLILVIAGMFIFAYLKKQEITETKVTEKTDTTTSSTSPYANITRLDAKHFFVNGKHTLVGEMVLPTRCDLLNWETIVAESMPEQVTIDLSVVNHTDDCEKVPTAQRFKIDFTASENASIRVRFDNRTLDLNLIPPAEGETPEDYELFIKG